MDSIHFYIHLLNTVYVLFKINCVRIVCDIRYIKLLNISLCLNKMRLARIHYVDRHFILLSLPNNVWRLIVFAPFLIIIIIIIILFLFLSFFPWTMNLSTADLRNYWTQFHETWWSYRYMFLVDP